MNLFSWTPEKVDELKRLHASGLSFSRMVVQLGCGTRNSAISKALRIGLHRIDPSIPRAPRKPRTRTPKKHTYRLNPFSRTLVSFPTSPLPDNTPQIATPSLRVPLLDLGPNQCRHTTDDGPFLFCGHPTLDGYSYCTAHARLCYQSRHAPPNITEAERHRRRLWGLEITKRKRLERLARSA